MGLDTFEGGLFGGGMGMGEQRSMMMSSFLVGKVVCNSSSNQVTALD